jgi:hypothetical protein
VKGYVLPVYEFNGIHPAIVNIVREVLQLLKIAKVEQRFDLQVVK